MIEKLLATHLKPVLEAEMQLRRRRVVTAILAIGAVGMAALFLAACSTNWWSWPAVFVWLGILATAAAIGLSRATRPPDLRGLARRVENEHPDLQAALLAAMDQSPSPDGDLTYLQRRLLSEISEHALKHRWVKRVSEKRLLAAAWAQIATVVAFCVALFFLLGQAPQAKQLIAKGAEDVQQPEALAKIDISVVPGDVEIEKGSRLIIEATFSGRAPGEAILNLTTEEREERIPMKVGLDDNVFSALIPSVVLAGEYYISFEDEQSPDYDIDVFEFPELSQADATVTPPAYLEEEPREILDTRKISVMEGAKVGWRMRVNKPVSEAELFGEDETIIALTPDPKDPNVLIAEHEPSESQRYRLHLIDDQDRSNRRPPWLTVNVKKNLPPKLKLTFPGRDFEISALQEMPFEVEAWDDVSLEKVGLSYRFDDEETSTTLSEETLQGGEKHALLSMVSVEDLGAKPRDLITYHFWAEDLDKDGNIRRTTSDMFFAEVRYFEEIFREGQPQQGQGEPGESDKLLRLQKEIINASWKLRREHDLGRAFDRLSSDVSVVHESQLHVLTLIDEVIGRTEDQQLRKIFEEAKVLMQQAAEEFALILSKKEGGLIDPAHQTALAVYAKLIEARSRETEISMSRSMSASASQQEQQRNMNLELKQKELKYEENTQADDPAQSAEQQENLEVLKRLKELARRQEAIAEKIKELEEQLQGADEDKKQEIERQLKRLQEEQRELLREVDDLSERMDSEQNRPNMAEEKKQLEETREEIQEAAEELEEGDLASAANAATRAQEELSRMEEDFRERTSRQFSEEMRGLREKARELAEGQESISEELEEIASNRENMTDPFSAENQQARGELAEEISSQIESLNEILDEMRTLS
ncbi:MAG: hypothetical protein AAGC68_10500, partial [Verrucomicrobiota bacterium]